MLLSSLLTIISGYFQSLRSNPLVFVLTFIVPLLIYLTGFHEEEAAKGKLPPSAQPSLPFLGNALYYQKNPDVFLERQAKVLGGVFRINLAGLQTTILSSRQAIKQMAYAPEKVLSSHAAISDFGFRYTLGDRNVFEGTVIHKQIIKAMYGTTSLMEETVSLYWKYLTETMNQEIMCDIGEVVLVQDFLVSVRRTILRSITYEMIGRAVVEMYDSIHKADFISDFMIFQDLVEDCTAKAAVCPEWLSSILFLKDCEQKRLTLVANIEHVLREAIPNREEEKCGKWLKVACEVKKNETEQYEFSEIADFIVGLLFAAHKNPSIAAAQSLLCVLDYDVGHANIKGDLVQEKLIQESMSIHKSIVDSNDVMSVFEGSSTIKQVVTETLRITAHSIGAIRKVNVREGWSVSVENEQDPSQQPRVYVLPYGSYVGVSHIVPHRKALSWGHDCDSFNPFREDLVTKSRDELLFTTFSYGTHKCPGSRVAMLIVRVFLAALLSKYEVSVPDNETLPSLDFERATLAQRAGPCRLKLKRLY